ncbi:polysaccharide deacetylase family protein [Longispora albida]|uniref:polysaccharide deacetylase family protein n=1 Tax=Longispora albida TaxID=203523 RepID=UPI00039A5834|nr:polysaccharide deacetylase family protein [Longispora albida]
MRLRQFATLVITVSTALAGLSACGLKTPPASRPANNAPSPVAAGSAEPGPGAETASPAASPVPSGTPGAAPKGRPAPVVNNGSRSGNKVALTFDADLTEAMQANLRSGKVKSYANTRVLDVLEAQKAPATFFMTGKFMEQYPDFTRRIAKNTGWELANHSYSHKGFTPKCYDLGQIPPAQMAGDVSRTAKILEGFGGRQSKYFRFPGLCHDPAALSALGTLGMTVVDGDVVGGDPFAKNADAIVNAVLSQAKPGSVVILHCTDVTAPVTDLALPRIIAGLRAKGLEPAPLSEVLGA